MTCTAERHGTDLPETAINHAAGLVGAVHTRDADMVAQWLEQAETTDGLRTLAVTLAAMVDDELTVPELLAWAEVPEPGSDEDIDEVVVIRRMRGEHLPTNHAEAREVVERLRVLGMSDRSIERRTGLNPTREAGSRERKAS